MGLRHGPNSYGRQQWGILHNGGNPDAATPRERRSISANTNPLFVVIGKRYFSFSMFIVLHKKSGKLKKRLRKTFSYAILCIVREQHTQNLSIARVPKYFFAHAASLHQGFPHCAIFPTAASRRSLGRVSVPMWPVTLSGRLLIVALVSRYLTN